MKPKPALGMNSQWTVDEEAIMAGARLQIALTQRALRLSGAARALGFFALGALLSAAVRFAADAQFPERAALVQALGAVLCGAAWLLLSQLSRRADAGKITNVALATQNIKYVPPPEADKPTAEQAS